MKFTNLFSSSKGNSLLVEGKDTKILVDAGLAGIHIRKELAKLDVSLDEIDAILVTHEHSDHIRGVGVLSRRADIPVYVHEEAAEDLIRKCGSIRDENLITIREDTDYAIKGLDVRGFDIPHDAVHPMGFIIDDGKEKMAVATDMGMVLQNVADRLCRCRFVFLEANHDEKMLRNGPYPYPLKKRILSGFGHLSNDASGEIASYLVKGRCERIRLGHLSEENNIPSLAKNTVEEVMLLNGIKTGRDCVLDVANRHGINETVVI